MQYKHVHVFVFMRYFVSCIFMRFMCLRFRLDVFSRVLLLKYEILIYILNISKVNSATASTVHSRLDKPGAPIVTLIYTQCNIG